MTRGPATQARTQLQPSTAAPGRVCGRWLIAPSHPARRAEGGMRVKGIYKRSEAAAPLVSVITVARNAAATLEQCMRSVFAQTHDNLEYIVIDGDSTDGSPALLARHAEALDYYIVEPDGGIYDAMNKGLALAQGAYILLLNADDWYQDEAVSRLLASALETGADVTHADARLVDAGGRGRGVLRGAWHDGLFTGRCPVRHETMLVSRATYERFGGYDASYTVIGDFAYLMTLRAGGAHFEHVPAPLLNFRTTGVSSTDQARLVAERARLFLSWFPFLEEADLALLNRDDLDNESRLALLDRHAGESELFSRSLACNLALSPEYREAARMVALLRRLRRHAWWRAAAPLRTLIRRALRW